MTIQDMRRTTMHLIRLWSSMMYVISIWYADTDVPEKYAACIFRAEEALKPGNGGGRVLQNGDT
jgi:hypothetical protein